MDDFDLIKCMERFKEKRLALGLSFQKLADKTGMSKATLQRYESGDIKNLPVDKLKILASALETTPGYLIGWNDTDKENSNDIKRDEVKKLLIDFLNDHNEILVHCNINPEKITASSLEELADDTLSIIELLSTKYRR